MTTRSFLRTETRALLWPSDGNAYVHREWVPPPPLRRYVECFRYGVESFATEQRERVLPDGSIHLVICHGATTEAVVVGGRCAPTMVRMSGRLEHVGVQLRPGAIAAVLGVPAAELTGYDVPLERLWGSSANVMLERLAEAPLHERPAIVGTMLMERIGAIDASLDPRATSAVTKILASAGKARVRDLADAVGVGERRLEQIFKRDVGLSPKALSRVTRFRHAVDFMYGELEHDEHSWADVAIACGFYDQAHLANDFRELAGIPPTRLFDFGFFQDGAADAR